MLDFLTDKFKDAIRNLNGNLLYEVRIRANKPTLVNYGGKYCLLGPFGIAGSASGALRACYADIEEIIYRASEFSVYSVTEQLRQGFLTGSGGERIGLSGIFVYERGDSFTVKEVTSLNVRVPHEVRGCSLPVYKACFSGGLSSVLILSAPGCGKTTILRDLARQISETGPINILIDDERNEISAAYRDFSLDVGAYSDIIRYSYKREALACAVRAMRPDLIVTDELAGEELAEVARCIRAGVYVVASAHARDIASASQIPFLGQAMQEKLFDYYVVLAAGKIGEIEGIYDRELCAC